MIFPHRNRKESLTQAILSLAPWREWIGEILVVDDASSPVQRPRCSWGNDPVRVIERPAWSGPAACRNEGARQARFPLLLFLDDDSRVREGNLADVVCAFQTRPQLAAVGFQIDIGVGQVEPGGAFNVFVACGAAVRRDAFLAIGGFPEEYGFYVEEYALCYRWIQAGYNVRMWHTPVINHEKSATGRDPQRIWTHLVRNNHRLLAPFSHIPDAQRRLDELIEWYRLLGRSWAINPVEQEAVLTEPAPAAPPSSCDSATWDRLCGNAILEDFVQRLRDQGEREVALWPIGKDTSRYRDALERGGVRVRQIVDPEYRMGCDHFADVPVVPAADPARPIVVASFSPGQTANALRQFGRSACRIHAAFGFLGPNDPPELQTSGYS